MIPRDTHPEAHRVQMAAFRAMTPEQRGAMAVEMSILIRHLAREGIRFRHPEYADADVSRALAGVLYGGEIARDLGR